MKRVATSRQDGVINGTRWRIWVLVTHFAWGQWHTKCARRGHEHEKNPFDVGVCVIWVGIQ